MWGDENAFKISDIVGKTLIGEIGGTCTFAMTIQFIEDVGCYEIIITNNDEPYDINQQSYIDYFNNCLCVGVYKTIDDVYIPDTIVKKSDIDLNKLQYLLNPVNIYQDDIPSNMINNNVEVYYIDQSFVDTRYFTYRLNNAVYAIQSIVYTGDYFEFKIAEGAPHSICKWDIYNGTWTREQ